MSEKQEKIKDFFEARSEKIVNKIEKTPMEKFFVFFLLLIAGSALVLGFLQFKKNVESPLYSSFLDRKRGELRLEYGLLKLNINSPQKEQITELQSQDSDFDGLDDYSELYIYKTNAYSEDSDGDGFWDKQEIYAGTDPNCGFGSVCEESVFAGSEFDDVFDSSQLFNINSEALSNYDLTDMVALEAKLLSGEITLKDLGIDDPEYQAMIDKVSSGELYSDNQGGDQMGTAERASAVDALKSMTPDEIRQELISAGMDESLLIQIDDESLRKLFLETLTIYK